MAFSKLNSTDPVTVDDYNDLFDAYEKLNFDNINLTAENAKLKNDLDEATDAANDIGTRLGEIADDNATLETGITTLKQQAADLQVEINRLKRFEAEVAELKSELKETRLRAEKNLLTGMGAGTKAAVDTLNAARGTPPASKSSPSITYPSYDDETPLERSSARSTTPPSPKHELSTSRIRELGGNLWDNLTDNGKELVRGSLYSRSMDSSKDPGDAEVERIISDSGLDIDKFFDFSDYSKK